MSRVTSQPKVPAARRDSAVEKPGADKAKATTEAKAIETQPGAAPDADAFSKLQNPYAATHVSKAEQASYARPGLASFNPLGARIAAMTGAAVQPRKDPDAYLASIADHAHLTGPIGTTKSGDTIPSVADLFPPLADPAAARGHAVAALEGFMVSRADGSKPRSLAERLDAVGFAPEAKERILDSFTRFHDSLKHHREFDPGSSDVNWKHICAEGAQVLDACELRGLPLDKTEDALLASLFSDAVKFPSTLLTHNIDGSLAALHVLSSHFDRSDPASADRLAGVLAATREHQIGPPSFMAMLSGGFIKGALAGAGEDVAAHAGTIESIQHKMADPMNAAHVELNEVGGGRIAFTDAEQALLQKIGIEEWAVPHAASDHFDASMAVICGDSLVNYAMPDGVGKIVDLSGPGSMFKDPTVFHSMFSCGQSFIDAQRIIGDDLQPMYAAGAERTKAVIAKVEHDLIAELRSGTLEVPAADMQRAIRERGLDLKQLSFDVDGESYLVRIPTPNDVPFVDSPLDYDAGGSPFELAKVIKQRVADELRSAADLDWLKS